MVHMTAFTQCSFISSHSVIHTLSHTDCSSESFMFITYMQFVGRGQAQCLQYMTVPHGVCEPLPRPQRHSDAMTSRTYAGRWAGEFAAMATTARCWKGTQ